MTTTNSASNVSFAKPATGGAVFRAPAGTSLPTSATATLGNAFKAMGYISDEGVKQAIEKESEDVKAWGGDIVGSSQTSFGVKYTLKFLEALSEEVQKAVFGDSNVTGSLSSGRTVNVNSSEQAASVWVIDTVLRDGVLSRQIIPSGKITEIGEIEYADGSPIGYEATITTYPDSNGNNVINYFSNPSTSGGSGGGA